ncbi:MAG: DUF2149 domain-containing protein [Porticoccaceae bacterium]|nr:DUF2149 domain-containing protein [Porticoccaceae bacterium]
MTRRADLRSRFDDDQEPMDGLANLVDIVLVFACGLVAVLATRYGVLPTPSTQQGDRELVVEGSELPELPQGIGQAGSGYQSVGTVYRDPQTGKLILVGEATP